MQRVVGTGAGGAQVVRRVRRFSILGLAVRPMGTLEFREKSHDLRAPKLSRPYGMA